MGRRGEITFEKAITDYSDFRRPLFRPAFLGDKWPSIDYHVELVGVRGTTPHFFAQVKSTTQAPSASHLEIRVAKGKLTSLFELPGPTYLVGVHEPTDRAFVLAVHQRPTQDVYRIPLAHELTPPNLRMLHQEVSAFWRSFPSKPAVSSFV